MRFGFLSSLVLFFLWLSGASLCGQKVLRVASYAEPTTFDPHLSGGEGPHPLTDFRYHAQLFESPLSFGLDDAGHGVILPSLCDLPVFSSDGKTLILNVRPGSRFTDDPSFQGGKGREVTAKDVVFSLMRHADPSNVSHFYEPFLAGLIVGLDAWRTQCVDASVTDYDAVVPGLKAVGERVVIKLTRVVPQFPALLTQTWASVVPREAIARHGSGFRTHPVGSGPFVLKEIDALKTVKMVRNPHYRIPGRPFADELRISFLPDSFAQSTRFDAGGLDLIELSPENQDRYTLRGELRSVHAKARRGLSLGVGLEVGYLVLNFEHRFLSKLPIRQALHLALDRERLRSELMGPRAELANSPVPWAFPESVVVPRAYDFEKQDLPRARKILADAGFPSGVGIPELILDAPGADATKESLRAAQQMIEDWAKIGLKVQLRTEGFGAFYDRAAKGQLQIAWVSWYADYPDVENFVRLFWSKEKFNYGRYQNDVVDELFAELADLNPGPRRTELVGKLVKVVRDDVAWIPLMFPRAASVVAPGVTNYRWNLLNLSLSDVDVTKPK